MAEDYHENRREIREIFDLGDSGRIERVRLMRSRPESAWVEVAPLTPTALVLNEGKEYGEFVAASEIERLQKALARAADRLDASSRTLTANNCDLGAKVAADEAKRARAAFLTRGEPDA